MTESGEDLLRRALTEAIAELAGSRRLVVVEVAAEGVTAFDLHRDEAGTSRGRERPMTRWAGQTAEGGGDGATPSPFEEGSEGATPAEGGRDGATAFPAEEAAVRATWLPVDARVVLVRSAPDGGPVGRAMEALRAARPDALALNGGGVPVAVLLREIVAAEPLRRPYDLVVLRRHPVTGRLRLACQPLFAMETRRGALSEVTVQCEPSDERGTVFAVVAWQDRRPVLVSVHAVKLPPGRYEVTAMLERPGRVRFSGLPSLTREDRSWTELVSSVPARLGPPSGPAHLICAVETTGPEVQLGERLRRVSQLVTELAGELSGLLQVSLVTYGAHSYDPRIPERPVDVVDWEVSPDDAQESLKILEESRAGRATGHGAAEPGYPYAAQVEDMLAEVAGRLGPPGGRRRTVLLTVGARPPHPPRRHASEILPCPRRVDWERQVRDLQRHPGLVFGAICDQPPERAHPAWARLGENASAHLDTLDPQGFCADLGVTAPGVQRVPFPLMAMP
ncbi:hypothetical protein [Sphaerisporangium corydalis]|uniref:Uncharacterized protein n=1 Tax=Sphaerisporangium corydalis TaxID=1441875 RepID=A0ABV9EAV3_9ACTN|nr:hypothetical protein [Sphaerisporangium corydalis]